MAPLPKPLNIQASPTSVGKVAPAFSILVAEDDPNDRLLFKLAFEEAGVRASVRFAKHGQQAINYLLGKPPFDNRLESPPPALLLLDLKMPVKDGFEVLDWLRFQPGLSNLVVIVLSSSNQLTDMARARSLGARHFLVKPGSLPELILLVRNLETLCRTLLPRVAKSSSS